MEKDHVYVIAEAGVNHNGERDKAFALIDAAVAAGADAVKFQTFKAAQLATTAVPKAHYQTQTSAADESQLEMLEKLELPWEWHAELKAHAKESGIQFLSTAFDSGSLVYLNELGIPRFKVPSGEITNGPLLWQFARTGKPLIVSTGMATLSDVEQALAVIFHARNHEREPASMDEVWRAWGPRARSTHCAAMSVCCIARPSTRRFLRRSTCGQWTRSPKRSTWKWVIQTTLLESWCPWRRPPAERASSKSISHWIVNCRAPITGPRLSRMS